MGYGRGPIPTGFLPVFTVDTEEEARALLVLTCPVNLVGSFIAPELARAQTLDNLELFAQRLERGYKIIKAHARKRKT